MFAVGYVLKRNASVCVVCIHRPLSPDVYEQMEYPAEESSIANFQQESAEGGRVAVVSQHVTRQVHVLWWVENIIRSDGIKKTAELSGGKVDLVNNEGCIKWNTVLWLEKKCVFRAG